ncbi:MAG: hypothetical protein QOI21_2599 [Actinomycetota bacterium]|jgi:hypothetical protein|nr:hypothetical protein [Actinomycetota bacterium]
MIKRVWLTASIVTVAILVALGGIWMPSDAQSPPAPTPPASPGTDHRVQKWFKDREALQIELNNALFVVQQLTGPSRDATSACTRLDRVTQRLLQNPRSPHPPLDAPVDAGITQFSQAAQACLRGDFPTMRQRNNDGVTQRANAQDAIDEILDGGQ